MFSSWSTEPSALTVLMAMPVDLIPTERKNKEYFTDKKINRYQSEIRKAYYARNDK